MDAFAGDVKYVPRCGSLFSLSSVGGNDGSDAGGEYEEDRQS